MLYHYHKRVFLLLAFVLPLVSGFSQGKPATEQAGSLMASEGKIYVVMAVVITILAGLLLYMWRLDKKISRIEKGMLDQ